METTNNFEWAEGMACAVTACAADGTITYMNRRARETYRKHGNLIGKNLYDCHNERSQGIIRRLIETGEANAYTIEKHGQRKMIYQTACKDDDGHVTGIVEISMVIPEEMPHYVRG